MRHAASGFIATSQDLRIRNFVLAAAAYGIGVILIWLAFSVKLLSFKAAVLSSVVALIANGAFLLMFRLRWNERFSDRSLTQLQTLTAIGIIMFVAYQFERERALVLIWCLVVLLFGVFRFRPREFLTTTLFMLAGHALVINVLMYTRPESLDVYIEWYQWAWLALILPAFALIGARIAEMRLRLMRSNQELSNALSTIQEMATHDSLTGLPNRVSLSETLQHAIARAQRGRHRLALLFIDLDHFKAINDTLGHPTGDQLLREVARRMRATVRESDLVARLGGDEFVVMVENAGDHDALATFAGKILSAIHAPMVLQGHDVRISASIGLALCPDAGRDVPTLLANADLAMYRAKELGRNRLSEYSEDLGESAIERFEVEKGLRRAIENHEFRLHYQPKMDFRTGQMIGVEALIRWHHPDLGVLTPDRFIPMAESNGHIVAIGQWVIEEACRQLAEWQRAGMPAFSVAVNLSAVQLADESMVPHLAKVIRQSGADPSRIELELTETTVMQDVERAVGLLAELRKLGVKLSIDDFGTGYSSLSYLKELPVDTLKVDRSFVKDLAHNRDDLAITRAVIAMAHGLSMRVVAEGVEDSRQFDVLREEGCDEFQGFYCRPAIENAELERLLARHGLSIPAAQSGRFGAR
jgi:diguanylate cyclase (GGDEF)-like protein